MAARLPGPRLLRWLATIPLLALATAASTQQSPAQTTAGSPAADSLKQTYSQALHALRDSVAALRAQLAIFGRDLEYLGSETVLSRATTVQQSCSRVSDAAAQWRPRFEPSRSSPSLRSAARDMQRELRRLIEGLSEHCERGLAPAGAGSRADTLKAWGPYRQREIEKVLSGYDRAAAQFARVARIPLQWPPSDPSR